jgi:hypothetical protein
MIPTLFWNGGKDTIMLETNGPGLWESIKDSWKHGGRKYFFHNLCCELRRGRYEECWDYKNTFWDRFLFSLGMFIMDPWGRYYFRCHVKHRINFPSTRNDMDERQWLRHPMFWVRRRAKKLIDSFPVH